MAVKVSIEENSLAFKRYNQFFDIVNTTMAFHATKFYEFLGHPADQSLGERYFTWPEEAARKVHMLCSPHWETLLKVYQINKEPA